MMMQTVSMFIVLSVLCATASPVQAQSPSLEGEMLLTLNLGPTFGTLRSTDEKAEGTTFNLTLERFGQENWSLGFNLAYLAGSSEASDGMDVSYWSLPTSITSRYMFGRGNFRPYIGGGVGVFISKSTENVTGLSRTEWGVNFSAPIGLTWFVDSATSLNLNWVPVLTTQSLFKNNWVHAVNIGVGFVL